MRVQCRDASSERGKPRSDRVRAIHALLGYLLLTGLGFAVPIPGRDELKLIDFLEEPPPPAEPARPEKVRESRKAKPKDPEGAAAPPNLKDTPTQIVAPKPEIVIPVPPPIRAAPVPGQGNAPAAGAAEIVGPGTGRGGIGTGLGSGTQGTGTGGGGGGIGRATPAVQIAGSIGPEDYPEEALRRRATGTVYMRFVVAPNGRVTECAVTRSSGSPALDETTCRLIVRRFRYRPARDGTGRPVRYVFRGDFLWDMGPEPPPIEVDPVEDPVG